MPHARMSATTLKLYPAHGFVARLLGLHALGRLSWHTGLWLMPCNAVHTFGLASSIDVVFLDDGNRVFKQVRDLKPNRVAFCLAARSVIDFPACYFSRQPASFLEIPRATPQDCPNCQSAVS